ncbi:MAG TPA: hypothetical protein ENN32_00800 [Chloroflexi bacterium]|nr:hypothetical protein [Chloroflexota bacterium]
MDENLSLSLRKGILRASGGVKALFEILATFLNVPPYMVVLSPFFGQKPLKNALFCEHHPPFWHVWRYSQKIHHPQLWLFWAKYAIVGAIMGSEKTPNPQMLE